MNKISKYILGLFVFMGVVTSCKDDEPSVLGLSLDKEEITITDPNGGVDLLKVSTGSEWQASTESTWLQFTPGNGKGSADMEVKADSSILANIREGQILFQAQGAGVKSVKVIQFGYNKEILLEKDEITLESSAPEEERFFDLKVTANVNFDVELSGCDWIEFDDEQKIDLDYGDRPRTGKLRFKWHVNVKEEIREFDIKFVPKGLKEGEEVKTVTLKVKQKSAPVLTDDRAGDSLAVLAIYQSLNGMFAWDATENMRNWKNVTLWKATDKINGEKIKPEMVGRIRSASFSMFNTKESIPYQVTQLRFAESLVFYSNANRDIKTDLEVGPYICELMNGVEKNGGNSYLKHLDISAYGLVKLNENFRSETLESLELSSNNFIGREWLKYIKKDNFKNLKSLSLTNMRKKSSVSDLSADNGREYGFRWETGFGKYNPFGTSNNRDFFTELLQWYNLEKLALSVGLLEGELPSDEELQQKGFKHYQNEDLVFLKDTISNDGKALLTNPENKIVRVWPNMKSLSLNLNFLTGKLPNWLLYHPYLDLWNPYSMIFPQELNGKNSQKEKVGFTGGEPRSMSDYSNLTPELGYPEFLKNNSYYKVYPLRDPNYKKPEEGQGNN